MRHRLIEYRWFRKFTGGSFYLERNWIIVGDYWTENPSKSCGGRVIMEEHYIGNKSNIIVHE